VKKRMLMQESEIPMTLDGWKLKISSKIASDLLNSILAELDVSRALSIVMTTFLFKLGIHQGNYFFLIKIIPEVLIYKIGAVTIYLPTYYPHDIIPNDNLQTGLREMT
jgi:hypothetical protein